MAGSPRVTLTFDNGPTPGVTDRVLDDLGALGVKATFFVLGKNLATPAARDLLDRAVREGHWIGNHTFTHTTSLGDSTDPGVLTDEIGRTQELLQSVAHPDRYFRPRGGGGVLDRHLLSETAVRYLQQEAYTLVLWNSVPRDWEYVDGWEARCRADIAARDWSVVVLHDLPTGAMRHLSGAVSRMIDSGVEFVQQFPDSCVPIRRGRLTGTVDHLVSAS